MVAHSVFYSICVVGMRGTEGIAQIVVVGTVVIGMNYYKEPVDEPEKHVEIRNGNQVYMDGILRMVTRTDDEWRGIFEKYFTVQHLEYYGWNNETNEKRRIFVLKKK